MSKYLDLLVKNLEMKLMGRPKAWLARESGVPDSTIGKLLRGEREPGIETVGRLAKALGCSIGELMGEPVFESNEELLKKIGELTMKLEKAQKFSDNVELYRELIEKISDDPKLRGHVLTFAGLLGAIDPLPKTKAELADEKRLLEQAQEELSRKNRKSPA